MHHPIDPDTLARVVSSKVGGNDHDYQYQEDCGSSDTSSFHKLVKQSDIHQTILVGVMSCIVPDDRNKRIVQRKFEQNATFLAQASAHNFNGLCPKVVAVSGPTAEFAFLWIAYGHIDGWPLASNWHQLKHEIRAEVIQNLASFVHKLASVSVIPTGKRDPSASFVGPVDEGCILIPPALVPIADLFSTDEDLKNLTSHGALVELLATKRAYWMSPRANVGQAKSLATQQILAIVPVCKAILDEPTPKVLAHLNLTPQNIWIDPFTGKITAIFGWEYAHLAPSWMATAPLPWLANEKQDLMLDTEKMGDPWSVWRPHFHHPPENTAREIKRLRTIWETSLRALPTNQLPFGANHEHSLKRQAMKVCFVDEKALGASVGWARAVVLPSAPILRPFVLAQSVLILALAAAIVSLARYFHTIQADLGLLSMIAIIGSLSCGASYLFHSRRVRSTPIIHPPSDTSTKVQYQQANRMIWRLDMVSIKARLPWLFGYSHSEDNRSASVSAVPCSPVNSIEPTGIFIPNVMSRVNTSF
ncbi:hypothetical protein FS842_000810 [Serendipita sp. 407]|nr:hypothetical protein FS842_000810 [Serendipita sp. 407]